MPGPGEDMSGIFEIPPKVPDPGDYRLGGLYQGPEGYSTGPGGGLDLELTRNNLVPPLPALAQGVRQPSDDPRNFSGSWYGEQYLAAFEIVRDKYGEKLPFTALGRKVMDLRLLANDKRQPYMTPAFLCRPSGPDWDLIRIPTRFFQSKDRVDIFSSADRMQWTIVLDPALLPLAGEKSYMGRSVGRWEGDTLVVENTDFKSRRWLSFRGTPVSSAGKLTYRIRKIHDGDRWYLEIVTQVEDPAYYTRPWQFVRSFSWRPDFAVVGEYNCEEQVGGNDSGSVPEPED